MEKSLSLLMGRRQFVLATVGLAGTSLLAACGNGDSSSDQSPSGDTAPNSNGSSSDTATPTQAASEESSGEPKRGGTLLIGQDFGPQDLDPTITGAWASTNILELVFTGLLRWTADMELEPDLATNWEISEDGLTYVFNLREGVKFHNGKDFSSEDVKFTIERIQDPEVGSPRISIYQDIGSIETPSATTVQFNLSQPIAPLLRNLATIPNGAIVPAGATSEELNTEAPGTGPFRFVEHVLDQEVRLEKFEDYYEEGLPYLDAVVFKLLADDTSISAALRSETVHMAWLKDPKVAQNVSQSTEGLQSVPGTSSRYLPVIFDPTQPPFDDVRVRRAMSLALDRKQIVQTVLGGFGSVGTFLPPSQLGGYVGDGSDLPYYTQDVEEAKRLLKEAGYDRLTVPEFKVVAANQLDVQCAQIMAEQWAAANIDVSINPMEVGAILEDWSSGNFQMAAVGGVWRPDPSNEVTYFYSKSAFGKALGINDPELDELIEQGLAETDPDARVKIYKQIEHRVLDQVYVIIPYTYPLRWELVWNYVKGYDVMASNARISVRKTWLDK